MRVGLLASVTCLVSACTQFGPQALPLSVPVYQYIGSKQCQGGGTALATMMRKLSDAGIPAMNVSCGTDGKMYPAMCGAPDGRIGIVGVPEDKVAAAAKLGFAPLSNLPDATKTVCPKTP